MLIASLIRYERALIGVRWALSEEREGRLTLSAPMEEVEDAYFAHRQTQRQDDTLDGASEGQQQQPPNMANAPKYGKRPRAPEEASALVQERRLRLAAALLEGGL